MPDQMTPTEDLVLEVLAARYRLGEHLWTFDARHRAAIGRLAARGLVNEMNGVVERTVRASLTDAGKKAALSTTYTPPAPHDAAERAELVRTHEAPA